MKRRIGVYSSESLLEKPRNPSPSVLDLLSNCPIIAAVNTVETFQPALASPTGAIYLLTGNPLNLPKMIEQAQSRGKICLVNIDFLDGLTRDKHAVEYLAVHKAAGIVSTRFDVLKAAQAFGLFTIQRTFAIDSAAVTASIKSISQFKPDAMEILPAMAAPKVAKRLHVNNPQLKIIGGGLLETVREIEELFAAGISSVTASDPKLWLI